MSAKILFYKKFWDTFTETWYSRYAIVIVCADFLSPDNVGNRVVHYVMYPPYHSVSLKLKMTKIAANPFPKRLKRNIARDVRTYFGILKLSLVLITDK
jgi:hypothetical protein